MYGRYGMDQLGFCSMIFLLFLNVVASLGRFEFLAMLVSLLMLVVLWRAFSRNIPKRTAENQMFLRYAEPCRKWLVSQFASCKDRKTHCHFRCPHCGQKIRVPKGRGKIQITCPKCQQSFVKKS